MAGLVQGRGARSIFRARKGCVCACVVVPDNVSLRSRHGANSRAEKWGQSAATVRAFVLSRQSRRRWARSIPGGVQRGFRSDQAPCCSTMDMVGFNRQNFHRKRRVCTCGKPVQPSDSQRSRSRNQRLGGYQVGKPAPKTTPPCCTRNTRFYRLSHPASNEAKTLTCSMTAVPPEGRLVNTP